MKEQKQLGEKVNNSPRLVGTRLGPLEKREMIIEDSVFGKEVIIERILIDLINSEEIQRLKGISQFGLPEKYYYAKIFSRYEHSIGVLILLRRLGAGLYEQIAGLLHDVSHTAFSHIIDYVLDDVNESFQDKIFSEFVLNTKIPEIMKKNGYDVNEILYIEKYPLLENHAPDVCADRLDYSLREMKLYGKQVKILVDSLINHNNEIIFNDFESAKRFSLEYIKMNRDRWTGNKDKMGFHLLSEVLKKSFKKKIITIEDLKNKKDMEIIEILLKSKEGYVLDTFNLFEKGFEVEYSEDGVSLVQKFRFVDPKVLINNKVVRLSEVYLEYNNILNNEKEKSKINRKLKVVR
ncbi:MAG: HD domain-containing protein [Nanoarchaeota archaeon]|jgi:HD superfamily phosphohydrolase|nr:HD domain-containing protein [Nanoarchaeota archaeon]